MAVAIKGTGGLLRNKSVIVSDDSIQILSKSDKVEATCPLVNARIVCCGYWESRAGIVGPTVAQKLILEVWDRNGSLVKLPDKLAHLYVDNFTAADIRQLAVAISSVRPDLLILDRELSDSQARKLVSPPSGTWTCPQCKQTNEFSEQLWLLKNSREASATIVYGSAPAPNEISCPRCGGSVKVENLAPSYKTCFIATAAMGTDMAEPVITLQELRDSYLRNHQWGQRIILAYGRWSPPLAGLIERHRALRLLARRLLVVPAAFVARTILDRRERVSRILSASR